WRGTSPAPRSTSTAAATRPAAGRHATTGRGRTDPWTRDTGAGARRNETGDDRVGLVDGGVRGRRHRCRRIDAMVPRAARRWYCVDERVGRDERSAAAATPTSGGPPSESVPDSVRWRILAVLLGAIFTSLIS